MTKWKIIYAIRSAKLSRKLSILLALCFVPVFFMPPSFVGIMALNPQTVFSMSGFYQLFTYWTIQASFFGLLLLIVSIILSGIVVEHAFKKRDVLFLILSSILVGGIVYGLLAEGTTLFIGASTISWAMAGAALLIVLRTWKAAPTIAKVYAGFLMLSFLLSSEISPVGIAELLSCILGGVYSYLVMAVEPTRLWTKVRASVNPY